MYKLIFYVPVEEANKVKSALFDVGAGKIGNYSHCCFESLGNGQFKALENAKPAIGEVGKLERVDELKVEMVVERKRIEAAVAALKTSHPYETPAYHVLSCENF